MPCTLTLSVSVCIYVCACVCVCVVDPVKVIGIYKGLLPSEFQSSLGNLHPTDPPPLEGEELTRAIKCLIDFLNQV